MLVDSHVNLHGDRYTDDLDEVLTRAKAAGVDAMLAISDQLSSGEEIEQLVADQPHMWRTVGVHPHHAQDYRDLDAQTLIQLAQGPKVVGIGECGLDNHYEYSPREDQVPVFRAHIDAARATGLPLIIHTREADEVMADLLEEAHGQGAFKILMHCYTSGSALAERALALGAYFSFSGIITFKKADDVRAIAQQVPLDRIMIETDCPFLAPVPHRGRRNEPSYLPHVADKLAEIKGVDRSQIDASTTEAFFALFQKAERPK